MALELVEVSVGALVSVVPASGWSFVFGIVVEAVELFLQTHESRT